MFTVQSHINQNLTLSDGKPLPAFASREVEKITDRDRDYQNRGWVSIFETETEDAKGVVEEANPQTTKKPEAKNK